MISKSPVVERNSLIAALIKNYNFDGVMRDLLSMLSLIELRFLADHRYLLDEVHRIGKGMRTEMEAEAKEKLGVEVVHGIRDPEDYDRYSLDPSSKCIDLVPQKQDLPSWFKAQKFSVGFWAGDTVNYIRNLRRILLRRVRATIMLCIAEEKIKAIRTGKCSSRVIDVQSDGECI